MMRVFDATSTFLDFVCILFNVVFLAFYVELNSGDHFYQQQCCLLGKGFIEVSQLKSILECPTNIFLVWWYNPDGILIEAGVTVPQRF